MRFASLVVLVFLVGCLDGWEKDPLQEKGLPLEQQTEDPRYQAPSPATLGLRIKESHGGQQESNVLGLVQANEGDQVKILVQGYNYDPSRVFIEDIIVVNEAALPGASFRYDPAKTELSIEWQVPDRFVTGVRDNFYVSPPIQVRLRARHHSITPEGLAHTDYRQIDDSFSYVVYRRFDGLQPTVVRMEPPSLSVVEGVHTFFHVIVDAPGSVAGNKQIFVPDIRVVQVVPEGLAVKKDGSFFVRLDKSRPIEQVDPTRPTLWKVPMMVDLRDREITHGTHNFFFGVQAISKYSLDNNVVCDATGECEYKEVSSLVLEGQFAAHTRLASPQTSLTFPPVVQAGQMNFVQWQLFDPEGSGTLEYNIQGCPQGANCACSAVVRQSYVQCMMEWRPACGKIPPALIRVQVRTVAKAGPPRTTAFSTFTQDVRVFQDHCSAGGAP